MEIFLIEPLILFTGLINMSTQDETTTAVTTASEIPWMVMATGIVTLLLTLGTAAKVWIDSWRNQGEGLSARKKSESDLHTAIMNQNQELARVADSLRGQRNRYWDAYSTLRNRIISNMPEHIIDELLDGIHIPSVNDTAHQNPDGTPKPKETT